MESLPVSLQERVTDHLREYIDDLQDEIKWDNSFAKSQSKLVAAEDLLNKNLLRVRRLLLISISYEVIYFAFFLD